MKNKKGLALFISLVLIIGIVLPSTLAVSTDQADSAGEFTVVDETTPPASTGTETPMPTEEPKPTESPVPSENEKPSDTETENTGNTDETATPTRDCTCAPAPAEGEAHQESCPLYVKPSSDASKHIDTCYDDCTDKSCTCPCHLFDRVIACTTLDEIWLLLEGASEETLNALTEDQVARIGTKIDSLTPAPAPAIVIEESEPPVPSEVDYAMVSYTNVAPLGDPVTGRHQ